MPDYRRWWVEGGTYFFTVVTASRREFLTTRPARNTLRAAFQETAARHPFEILAVVILPQHLHTIWTLPEGDSAYARRWSGLKSTFTRAWLAAGGEEAAVTDSQAKRARRGVWQRNYWAHCITSDDDLAAHLDYIHYNPVKHGLARCPHEWPHSTFRRWVRQGIYPADWGCVCAGKPGLVASLADTSVGGME